MKRFFFDLVGDIPARDFMGHECSSKKEFMAFCGMSQTHEAMSAPGGAKRSFAKVITPGSQLPIMAWGRVAHDARIQPGQIALDILEAY
jgi:hypothetical protein